MKNINDFRNGKLPKENFPYNSTPKLYSKVFEEMFFQLLK